MADSNNFFTKFKSLFSGAEGSNVAPEVEKQAGRSFTGLSTAPDENRPIVPRWFHSALLGQPRDQGFNIFNLRKYGKSPWVQMVINSVKKQIQSTEWKIINTDPEDDTDYESMIKEAVDLLEDPNENDETFDDLWAQYLNDLLLYDAGVMWKGFGKDNKLEKLQVYDGPRFLIEMNENGVITGYYQYSFKSPTSAPRRFETDEIIYGAISRQPEWYPYGLSPLQTIQQEVEVLIQSTRYNKDFFKNNMVPDSLIYLNYPDDRLQDFQNQWKNQVEGKPHKMVFTNKELDVKQMSVTNKDMEWLEGQQWYHHLVFGAYGLSPQEAGFYEGSGRATGESQERISIKNAIKPYLSHIRAKINREILPAIFPEFDVKAMPIMFEWFPKDHVQEKIEHEQEMSKLESGVLTINEVRSKDGLDPVEWGDVPLSIQSQESADKEEDKGDTPEMEENEEATNDELPDNGEKSLKKNLSEPDLVEDAQDMGDFLSKTYTKIGKQVMNALDTELQEVGLKKKGIIAIISPVFKVLNSQSFASKIFSFVGKALKGGITDAEEDMKVDIGFTSGTKERQKVLTDEQLYGYTINGKEWKGIVGTSRELQFDILKAVDTGILERKSISAIKEDVSKLLAQEIGTEESEGRAMRIARTETTNIRNKGRLQAYKDSGVEGKKVWNANRDIKTSKLCSRLDGQLRGVDEPFIDEITKNAWMTPSSHPNCRCSLGFIVKE